MLSLIEVECPHCGAKGQIVVPPVGSIIIGPCPQCDELVIVFCGQVLALDRAIMETHDREKRQDHVVEVLMEFLRDRVEKLMLDQEMLESHALEENEMAQELEDFAEAGSLLLDDEKIAPAVVEAQMISQGEFQRFLDVDLNLLDNTAYFKSVFGQ